MYNHHHPTRLGGLRRALALAAALLLAVPAFAAGTASAADGVSRMSGVVNVNTAGPAELQLLPGVGEKRAAAIVDARKRRGGFKSVDELTEVKGVGDAMLERLRPHLTLSGKTTAKRL